MSQRLDLHRGELVRAVLRLTATDVTVLLATTLAADPQTARLTLHPDVIALRLAIPTERVRRALDRLLRHGFLFRIAREGEAELLELGPVLLREGSAPENLPFEPMTL